ncbi:MAG TPA: gamma-glutamyl-gamma-aminobutyrate hydrolase family protein [Polyangiales bacterium]|nr:gamma-glutamyl-gamma-aminobutyrate hydrolase family protein [Polyangiales bacterium]
MSSLRSAIVLQHVPFEGPARLAHLFEARGFAIDVRRLDQGAEVPVRLDPGDVLIVMGGPMGIADADSPEHSFLKRELALLARCVDAATPVLGVCLGAQLLAHAAGARVAPMLDPTGARRYELGWGPIALHRAGADDRILGDLPASATVLHWHADAFELPTGARRLASSEVCPNQAFQLGQRQFGLQFHCEVAAEHVAAFLRADVDFVVRALGADGVERVWNDTQHCADLSWRDGRRLLGNMLDAMLLL